MSDDDTLTLGKILRAKRLLEEGSMRVPRYQIIETAGGYLASVRRHSRSRNGRKASYHRRIQKKWDKRFGTRWLETQKRGEVYILNGTTVLVRREDAPQLYAAIA